MRKKILLVSLLVMAFLFTGCAAEEQKTEYALSEIYNSEAYGFYIKYGDTFYPVTEVQGEPGYRWNPGRIHCPKVTDDNPLVAVYSTNQDMPDEYFIEKFDSLGFTIGSHVKIGEDMNSLWLDTGTMCEGSDLQMIIDSGDFDDLIEIDSINEQKPLTNVDTDINVLTGLQEDKYYDLAIYSGTRNLSASVCADTEVLKSRGVTALDSPLIKTHKKYFIVNLPNNLKKGYYDINGEGLFYYDR